MYKFSFLPAAVMGSFSNSVTLGSVLLGGLITVATLVTLMLGVKYRVLADQQGITIKTLETDRNTWKDIAEQRTKNLEEEHAEKARLLLVIADLKAEKARLESLPDLSIIKDQMRLQEEAANTRHQELIQVLSGSRATQ